MDALTFLYWSLGVGWAVLIVFLVVVLIYVIRILRDVSNTTAIVSNTAMTVNDNVEKIAGKIVDLTEQISEYVIKPFTMAQYLVEKIKPFVEMMQQKGEEIQDMVSKKNSKTDDEKATKKRGFGRKKKEKD